MDISWRWSVKGMVRGYYLTLVREWNGPSMEWSVEKKMKTQQINISFRSYTPGMLLFFTTEFGVEFG